MSTHEFGDRLHEAKGDLPDLPRAADPTVRAADLEDRLDRCREVLAELVAHHRDPDAYTPDQVARAWTRAEDLLGGAR